MASAKYLGHSAVLVTGKSSSGTKTIIIDPFLDGNPRCPSDLVDPGPVDWICLSHGHFDHTCSAPALAKKYNATVFAAWELGHLMIKEGVPEGQIQFMNSGGTVTDDGISVTLTRAVHSSSYDASDGHTYYAGEAAGIGIRFADGLAVYHAGDTLLFSDMKLIGEALKPDLAFLPIGDRLTMGPKDAAAAALLIRPKMVVPIHYATFPGLSGTPEQFVEALSPSIKAVVLEPGMNIDF